MVEKYDYWVHESSDNDDGDGDNDDGDGDDDDDNDDDSSFNDSRNASKIQLINKIIKFDKFYSISN